MKSSVIQKVWLITPPFTQVNTPYPATTYLKGYLNRLDMICHQSDLSLEVFLQIFSRQGLEKIFNEVAEKDPDLNENCFRIWSLHENYLSTIDPVIEFLQNQKSTLAYLINKDGFLPRAGRFNALIDLHHAFGSLGLVDRAKYLATLYLEDLADFIKEVLDPHFGFSRYAEKIATALSDFNAIEKYLKAESLITISFLEEIVQKKILDFHPELVAITIPFPGNLFAALKTGQFIKSIDPEVKIVIGGGYCNTELRSIYDPRIFNYFDYVILDDGERPLQLLIEYLNGKIKEGDLKRTFLLKNGTVQFVNGAQEKDVPQRETGTPDYTGLLLDKYVSILEVLNPMHRLWSDGRWNKLTMAHGCYWGKCTFCDITLDYISNYEPLTGQLLCDRIEQLVESTGDRGFHFVDEAAPPALMRDMALEILRRGLQINWWTNIRFEKSFTPDLCRLLAASGCIAVSGGLEVASDRLLKLIQKGVTVEQVIRVAKSFTEAGIKVHAYLMYGFPTQTVQETIDALEIVRQMFLHDVIQSGFWHLFTMTAHSPVGQNPTAFQVVRLGPEFAGFAENDLQHEDLQGADHHQFSDGLKLSLFNYMNRLGLKENLSRWFSFQVPSTKVRPNYIRDILLANSSGGFADTSKVIWLGGEPISKDERNGYVVLDFSRNTDQVFIKFSSRQAEWFLHFYDRLILLDHEVMTFKVFRFTYEERVGDFELFIHSATFRKLRKEGLLIL